MSEPWMLEMSKHSMRRGSTSRSRRSRSARRISCDCRRGLLPLQVERESGVAHDEVEQPPLLAAPGTWIRTGAPRRAASQALEQLLVGDVVGHEDLPRNVPGPRRSTAGGWRRGTASGSVSRSRRNPSRATTLPSRTENTWTAARSPSTWAPKRSRSSMSVVVIFWGASSRPRARIWSRTVAASSKRSPAAAASIPPRSRRSTSSVRPPGTAARPREPSVAVQASRPRPRTGAMQRLIWYWRQGRGRWPFSVSLHERIPNSLRTRPARLAAQAGGDVGPAVGVAVLGGPPHDVEAGVLLVEGELEVGMVLVVPQPHVERRLVALDEVVLEGERLHLAVGDHEVEIGDLLHHAGSCAARGGREAWKYERTRSRSTRALPT